MGAAVFVFCRFAANRFEKFSPFQSLLPCCSGRKRASRLRPFSSWSLAASRQTALKPLPFEILLRLLQRAEARKLAPPFSSWSLVAPQQTVYAAFFLVTAFCPVAAGGSVRVGFARVLLRLSGRFAPPRFKNISPFMVWKNKLVGKVMGCLKNGKGTARWGQRCLLACTTGVLWT